MESCESNKIQREINSALKNLFGFDNFKGNQQQIIEKLLEGNDVFVIKPTGGGKSLCYQLPAMISEGTAIVISPLISLMRIKRFVSRFKQSVSRINLWMQTC